MTYNDRQLEVIDDRIRRGLTKTDEVGTVVSVETTRLRAMVVFDTASNATPVKVAGHVHPMVEDRVILNRYMADWYIMGVTNRIDGPNFGNYNGIGAAGTIASATPANLPGSPTFEFTKRWDNTPTLLFLSFSAYVTTSLGSITGHLSFAGTIYKIFDHEPAALNVRLDHAHTRKIPDAASPTPIPAGVYTVNLMWSRQNGTGTVTGNDDDWVSAFALEGGT